MVEKFVVVKSVLLCFSPILGLFFSGAYIDNTPSPPSRGRTGAVVIALGERVGFMHGSGAPRRSPLPPKNRPTEAYSALLLLMTVLAQTFFTFVSGHLVAFSFLSAGHCCCLGLEVGLQVLGAKDISGHLP